MRNRIKKTVVLTFTKKGLLWEKKIKKENAMSLKLFIAVAFYCPFLLVHFLIQGREISQMELVLSSFLQNLSLSKAGLF